MRIPVLAVAVVVALGPSGVAWAWGPVAQAVVTAKAIDALPKGLKEFYKAHRLEMPTLALEPTFPEDGPDRRFAADRLMPFPFADLPHSEASLKQKYGDAVSVGRLPWLIHESYARLVDAFKAKDKTRILEESDNLASLVAQMDNPLALTDNADGQKSEQHGLYLRFSTKFPEAVANKLKVDPDAAVFLDDPKGYVFSMLTSTYVWVDNVMLLDEIAKRGKSAYGDIYFEDMAGRATDLLSRRLTQAANDSASYWYTAWTDAQRPELK